MKLISGVFRSALQVVRENLVPYLVLNIVFFAVYSAGVVAAAYYPEIHSGLVMRVQRGLLTGSFSEVATLYAQHDVAPAIGATFAVNFFFGSILMITLPSALVPFGGFVVPAIRFFIWGFLFGPERAYSVPILILTTLEGQGYVLAAFASYVFAMRWLLPARYGLISRKAGYTLGLRLTGRIYALVALVLLVAAIYEPVMADKMFPPPFPQQPSAELQNGFSGQFTTLTVTGAKMYYQSDSVQESDAKIVGVLLEDMRYFRVGRRREARLSKVGNAFRVQLPLDARYWHHPGVVFHFDKMLRTLTRTFPDRIYTIDAFCEAPDGSCKDTVFQHSGSLSRNN